MSEIENDTAYGIGVITSGPNPEVKVTFDIFKELDSETHRLYGEAYERVRKAMTGDIQAYATEALRQLESMTSSIKEKVRSQSIPHSQASLGGWRHSLSCGVLTFAAALHLFQEQTINRIEKLHGVASEGANYANQVFANEYDKSFEYRLMYRLRNVMVHHSMDCIGLNIHSKEDRSPAGLIIQSHVVQIPLSRNAFLTTKRGVSAEVRNRLISLDEDPDLLSFSVKALESIERIARELFHLSHPSIEQDMALVRQLENEFNGRSGQKILVKIPEISRVHAREMPISLPQTALYEEVFEYARTTL